MGAVESDDTVRTSSDSASGRADKVIAAVSLAGTTEQITTGNLTRRKRPVNRLALSTQAQLVGVISVVGSSGEGFPVVWEQLLDLVDRIHGDSRERRPGGGSLRSRLQAHPSMRKCWGSAVGGFQIMLGRRTFLSLAGALAASAQSAAQTVSRNKTVEENQKQGTVEWQLAHYKFDNIIGSGLRSPMLEGYASEVSVYPGENLQFLVSADPPRKFTIDIYRTGYYGGKGGRHIQKMGPLTAQTESTPRMGMERVRECAWKPAASLTIPLPWANWVGVPWNAGNRHSRVGRGGVVATRPV